MLQVRVAHDRPLQWAASRAAVVAASSKAGASKYTLWKWHHLLKMGNTNSSKVALNHSNYLSMAAAGGSAPAADNATAAAPVTAAAGTAAQQRGVRHQPAAAVLLGFPVMLDVPGVAGVHHFSGEREFAVQRVCYKLVVAVSHRYWHATCV